LPKLCIKKAFDDINNLPSQTDEDKKNRGRKLNYFYKTIFIFALLVISFIYSLWTITDAYIFKNVFQNPQTSLVTANSVSPSPTPLPQADYTVRIINPVDESVLPTLSPPPSVDFITNAISAFGKSTAFVTLFPIFGFLFGFLWTKVISYFKWLDENPSFYKDTPKASLDTECKNKFPFVEWQKYIFFYNTVFSIVFIGIIGFSPEQIGSNPLILNLIILCYYMYEVGKTSIIYSE